MPKLRFLVLFSYYWFYFSVHPHIALRLYGVNCTSCVLPLRGCSRKKFNIFPLTYSLFLLPSFIPHRIHGFDVHGAAGGCDACEETKKSEEQERCHGRAEIYLEDRFVLGDNL